MTYRVRELAESDYPAWDAFVARWGNVYSTAAYLDILCTATGGRFRILGAYKGDECFGGIALYEEERLGVVRMTNRLLLYYNGFVVRNFETRYPSEATSRELGVLQALEPAVTGRGYHQLVVHQAGASLDARPFKSAGWHVSPAWTYVVDIADTDAAWQRVEQNQRRLVSRARKGGVTCTEDDDFDSFFAHHLENAQRKVGACVYLAREDFGRYVALLREAGLGRLYHARLPDGTSAASQLVLTGPHARSHTVTAGAVGEHLKLGVNPFLRWQAFTSLAEDGYRSNDLTDAMLNPVTRFKSQLGGTLTMNLVLSRPEHLRSRLEWAARRRAWALRERIRS